MNEDDLPERIKRLRRRLERRAFEQLVETLPAVSALHDSHGVAIPMTAHPALSHAADFVRSHNKPQVAVISANVDHSALKYVSDSEPKPEPSLSTKKSILTKTEAVGPAPYVGDPRTEEARYIWSIWTDDLGRHIAGEAILEWRAAPSDKLVVYWQECRTRGWNT